MTTFLFWNLNRKPLQGLVVNLALEYRVDVLMLVESEGISPHSLLEELNSHHEVKFYNAPNIIRGRVAILTNLSQDAIKPLQDEDRLSIREVNIGELGSFLLAVVHLPSKLFWSDASQALGAVRIADAIRGVEAQIGHSRTVLVGDLNMNPFEDGIVSAFGLHGIPVRKIVAGHSRQVDGKDYPFFYNPMWNLFGDHTPGPPGTYYYNKSEPRTYLWNMFDQVLIRPDVLSYFHHEDLKILTSDGKLNLLSERGVPDVDLTSDHLPLLFQLRH